MPQNMFAQLNIFPHPLKQFQQLCTCKELVDHISCCTFCKYGEYLESCKSLVFYPGQTLYENQKLYDTLQAKHYYGFCVPVDQLKTKQDWTYFERKKILILL